MVSTEPDTLHPVPKIPALPLEENELPRSRSPISIERIDDIPASANSESASSNESRSPDTECEHGWVRPREALYPDDVNDPDSLLAHTASESDDESADTHPRSEISLEVPPNEDRVGNRHLGQERTVTLPADDHDEHGGVAALTAATRPGHTSTRPQSCLPRHFDFSTLDELKTVLRAIKMPEQVRLLEQLQVTHEAWVAAAKDLDRAVGVFDTIKAALKSLE